MEETLVEEQEEGELAHLSWVRNYDRPLPQVALFHYFIHSYAAAGKVLFFAGNHIALLPR